MTTEISIRAYLLSGDEWNDIEQLIDSLRPFFVSTKKLQSEECTLSDFYGFWVSIQFQLKRSNNAFADLLLQEMTKYFPTLLENPIVLAAVYLDPRYQMSLNPDNKKLAIAFLGGLYKRLSDLKEKSDHGPTVPDTSNNESDLIDDFRSFMCSLRGVESLPDENVHTQNKFESEVILQLKKFNGVEIPVKSSILQYWDQQKEEFPLLYLLASIIFSVPPTQTSVERAFSALAIVLSPLRTRIADKTLQNILLIRLNYDFYKEMIDSDKQNAK